MNLHLPSTPNARVASPPESIGVFDSGVGGLTILRALHARLPEASLHYIGDAAHAPYGERSVAEITARCHRIVEHLQARGASLIVVACNTATAACIESLRAQWTAIRFVGVEPGIKPAAASSRSRRIAVMTTPATAVSSRLARLIDLHAARRDVHVHVQPCPGLAMAIERGLPRGTELTGILEPFCRSIRAADVDTVVLGCTHYPFVADAIQDLLGPAVTLVDTASAVAARVSALRGEASSDASGTVRIHSTGARDIMQRLMMQCPGLEHSIVEAIEL
jgi:glutamate racemase